MPSIKELSQKIVSLKNTQKVTKTMKLVSNSKLRLSQLAYQHAKGYKVSVDNIFRATLSQNSNHKLLTEYDQINKILILVFCSDKGLCGGFNNNLLKYLAKQIKTFEREGKEVDIMTIGNRAYNFCSKRFNVIENHEELASKISFKKSQSISMNVKEMFLQGIYQEIYVCYNEFESILKQNPKTSRYLPFKLEQERKDVKETSFLYDSSKDVFNYILSKNLNITIFLILLENSVGEHAARMAAMDSATSNGDKLIDEYTLLRNRVRQTSITTELTEIVAGAESLK